MIGVSVTVDNEIAADGRAFDIATQNGLNAMANDYLRIANPKTPMKTGRLRNNITKSSGLDRVSITYNQVDYAEVQEAGVRAGSRPFSHYTTPGTGPHFAQNARDQIDAKSSRYFK